MMRQFSAGGTRMVLSVLVLGALGALALIALSEKGAAQVADGTIIIEKQTDPDAAPGSFSFFAETGFSPTLFTLADNGSRTYTDVAPGTYNFRERDPWPEFRLASISCDDGNSTGDVGTRTATVRVEAGETVRCVFGNEDVRGQIVIEKQTDPDAAPGSFSFFAETGFSPTLFTLADNGSRTYTDVAPGTYNFREADPGQAGFGLTSIACDDSNSTGDVETRTATVRVDPGETVRCVFTNEGPGTIIIEKQTDPDAAPGSFSFFAETGFSPTLFTLADNGSRTYTDVAPGTYNFRERDPWPEFRLASISCDDGNSTGDVGTRTATVRVEAGETVRCVFGNEDVRGQIVIEKQTDPDAAPGSFSFFAETGFSPTLFTLADNGSRTYTDVAPGTYNFREADPGQAGFGLTSIACDDSNSTGDVETRTATVRVDPGETVRCVFTNTRGAAPPPPSGDDGTVVIEKQTDVQGSEETFFFLGGGFPNSGPYSLKDDDTRSFTVPPGTYAASEVDPGRDYALSAIRCDDVDSTGNLATRTATIRVTAGEVVRCTFDNTNVRGTVTIEKQTDVQGSEETFFFLGGGFGNEGAYALKDDDTRNFTVPPGTYAASEVDPGPAWGLADLSCDDGNSASDLDTRMATIRVEPKETVRCVFRNEGPGTVVIEKQTDVQGSEETFFFLGGGFPNSGPYSLKDDDTRSFTVPPGTYAASEVDPGRDYALSAIRCDDVDSTGNLATRTATIRVTAGEVVRCTFDNTNVRGTVTIEKQTDVQGSEETFFFLGGGFGNEGAYALKDDDTRNFTVPPGTYAASEVDPGPAWGLADLSCDDGNSASDLDTRMATIRVEPKETVRCVFRNEGRARVGTIVVRKLTVPEGSTETFTFAGDAAGTIGDGGTIEVPDLPAGTYASSESAKQEWDLTSIACDDGDSTGSTSDRTATFRLAAGETVTCTFTNTKRGTVTLTKTTNGVVNPARDISFVLTGTGLPAGGITRSTYGDQDGVLEWPPLVPGQFTVCESPVPAGFTSFWKLDESIVTPYNPDASTSPPEDLGTRCYDFSVAAGQGRAFEVDNSRPGGDPRTIGYWKNWNRCTGGNQAAVAAKNGGAVAGFFLVEDLLPQLVGDFSVTSCRQAVRLLSKQDQGGKNKASDAAYELGAQLLSARLNLAAGAETCPAVQQAVLDGQTLLDGIGFTGSNDYLGSKSKDPRRAQALSLAAALDAYNNGDLC